MQWFRTRTRIVASAILVALVGLGGLSSAVHGGDCHDHECSGIGLRHDPSSHGIGTPDTASDYPLHCILCHWTRSMRPSTDAVAQIARPLTNDIRLHPELQGALSPIQAAQPPLRSPPTAAAPIS
jgi:hypothetical protein